MGLERGEDLRELYDGTSNSQGDLQPPPGSGAAEQPSPRKAGWLAWLKGRVKALKREVLALHYATQDSRLGLLPRVVALLAIAYALSPLDLIPDFIPVLGIVDDVLILGALLWLAFRLVPEGVMAAARQRAEREPLRLQKSWGMALLFFAVWDALLLWAAWLGCRYAAQAHPDVAAYTVWIMAGVGVAAATAQLAWAVRQWRRESRMAAVLAAAGTQPELQEALLQGGPEAVQAYLEP